MDPLNSSEYSAGDGPRSPPPKTPPRAFTTGLREHNSYLMPHFHSTFACQACTGRGRGFGCTGNASASRPHPRTQPIMIAQAIYSIRCDRKLPFKSWRRAHAPGGCQTDTRTRMNVLGRYARIRARTRQAESLSTFSGTTFFAALVDRMATRAIRPSTDAPCAPFPSTIPTAKSDNFGALLRTTSETRAG
jgi:hypothetical protein